MNWFREARIPGIFLLTVVAVAYCYAEYPESDRLAVCSIGVIPKSGHPTSTVSINRLSWSADGKRLLALRYGDCGPFGPLVLHDVVHQSEVVPIDLCEERAAEVALARDGRHVLVGTTRGKLWWISIDSERRENLLDLPPRTNISAVSISREGQLAAAVDSDGNVFLCDLGRMATSQFAVGLGAAGTVVRFSRDGGRLVAAGSNGSAGVWEVPSGRLMHFISGNLKPKIAADFLAEQDRILSASLNEAFHVWDLGTGAEILRNDVSQSTILCAAVSEDGRMAAYGGTDRRIVIWDVETGREMLKINTNLPLIRCLKFSPNDQFIAAAGWDDGIYVFEVKSGTEYRRLELGSDHEL